MKWLAIFALSLLSAELCMAQVDCPGELTNNQTTTPVGGWSVLNLQRKSMLREGIVFSGNPAKQMSEISHREETGADANGDYIAYIWELDKIDEPWLQCSYEFTSLALVQKINQLKICKKTKRWNKAKTVAQIESVHCE